MAFEAAGVAGVMAVAIAGWTTANPTLYRAGLALQSVTPNWPRWKITLAAGAVTSVLSCFPVFFMKLLDYVAIYGLILMPMGAIVLVEHWVLPRIGVEQYVTERRGAAFNWNALLVWVGTLALAAVLPMHLFFRWLPCFFVAIAAYTALAVHDGTQEALLRRRAHEVAVWFAGRGYRWLRARWSRSITSGVRSRCRSIRRSCSSSPSCTSFSRPCGPRAEPSTREKLPES